MKLDQRYGPLLLKAEIAYPVNGNNAVEEILSAYKRGIRNFSGSEIYWESLYQAELQGIIFTNSQLTVDLCEAKLTRADFSNCDLNHSEFIWADLRLSNFSGSNLTRVNFIEADLRGANLKNTCLERCCMNGADLRGADLEGVNLDSVKAYDAKWE